MVVEDSVEEIFGSSETDSMGHSKCLGLQEGDGVRNESHVLVWKIGDPYHRERRERKGLEVWG